jgi:nicotinamidase-related amidase
MTTSLNAFPNTRLTPEETALLLIDHQSGIMQIVHDFAPMEFRSNVMALAKLGKVYGLPTVLTSSYEDGPNGPLLPGLLAMHPDAPVIRRPGQISAWDNEDFVAAVKRTGRKKLVMAGVTTDVCLAYPAMQAVAEGFQVYAVIDASGAYDLPTQQMAVTRMTQAGVTCVNWVVVATELQRDWRRPTGAQMGAVFHEHYLNYSMLIDNFSHTSKAVSK